MGGSSAGHLATDSLAHFNVALVVVGDLEAGWTSHLYNAVCTWVAIPLF